MSKAEKLLLFLAVCFYIQQTIFGQSVSPDSRQHLDLQNALRIEADAGELGDQWNGQSIRHSISLFSQAAAYWKHSGNDQKAAVCFREMGRLGILVGKITRQ